jgi:hypothetical protein
VSVLLLLLSIAPAGFLSASTAQRLHNNAVVSSLVALLILVVTTTVAAIVLVPEPSSAAGSDSNETADTGGSSSGSGSSKVKAYVLVVFWGLGNGWKWTSDRLASATLCPPRQSGEFTGLYLFSTIGLTWLPPLVFTVLNEPGVPMQVGLATLNAWFLVSAAAYLLMGQYRAAVDAISTFTGEVDSAGAAEESAGTGVGAPAMEGEGRGVETSSGRDLRSCRVELESRTLRRRLGFLSLNDERIYIATLGAVAVCR